jgi:L-seryl-tRNA(Ser) seleniumtransferase
MAIKPPDILNRLPSVSELLEKPPVRALAERWNRSVVAGRVRTFLEELRGDIERRAADLPSIRELAERAARYVSSRQHQTLGVAINATGYIFAPQWLTIPLGEKALERMVAQGREYTLKPIADTAAHSELQSTLCRLTGAQAATVVHSYSSAVWLALGSIAAGREMLVSRAEVGDVNGEPLPAIAHAAGTMLKEVGGTNRSTASDYESAISPNSAAIIKLSADSYRVVGDTASAELAELVAVARSRELTLIDALGAAPLIDPPATITWPRRSAQASVSTGAELVVLRGDGMVGGPVCGILLGNENVIRRIEAHPMFSACALDPLRAGALATTLECYDSPNRGADAVPVWQMLTTSVDNLRNRAQRLAGQLAHADGISAAIPTEIRSPISTALPGDGWPSCGVALVPADGNVLGLDARLKSARFPIVGRVEGQQLVLDLRTVLPRQDRTLIDALLGATTETPATSESRSN